MLKQLGCRTLQWIENGTPWSNVYGLARTLLALGTMMTLLASPTTALFRPGTGVAQVPACAGPRVAGLFCQVAHHGGSLEVARWLAVAALLLVASGWRPRYTGLLHSWVSWSLASNALVLDGGDQVATVLSWILVPVTITDSRIWHWNVPPAATQAFGDDLGRVVAKTALFVARVQVAVIYFQALVGKLAVPEWVDGTALWYWLLHPDLGAPSWLLPVLRPVISTPAVAFLTWGVLALEGALTLGLFLPQWRSKLLVWGIALHAGIFVVHGLMSFAMCMFAALILYLRPVEQPFRLRLARGNVGRRLPRTAPPVDLSADDAAALAGKGPVLSET